MPKEYLFKLHVILGYNSTEIANIHQKELGVKISERTVRDYLQAYGIYEYRYKPREKQKPKKKKPYNRDGSTKWLRELTRDGKDLKSYLDSLSEGYRTSSLRKFFKDLGKKRSRKNLNKRERKVLAFIIKHYNVSGNLADLALPYRKIIIDWPRINEIRLEQGLSKYMLCKKSKIDMSTYFVIQRKLTEKTGYRKTALKIARALKVHASEISKEIKE